MNKIIFVKIKENYKTIMKGDVKQIISELILDGSDEYFAKQLDFLLENLDKEKINSLLCNSFYSLKDYKNSNCRHEIKTRNGIYEKISISNKYVIYKYSNNDKILFGRLSNTLKDFDIIQIDKVCV